MTNRINYFDCSLQDTKLGQVANFWSQLNIGLAHINAADDLGEFLSYLKGLSAQCAKGMEDIEVIDMLRLDFASNPDTYVTAPFHLRADGDEHLFEQLKLQIRAQVPDDIHVEIIADRAGFVAVTEKHSDGSELYVRADNYRLREDLLDEYLGSYTRQMGQEPEFQQTLQTSPALRDLLNSQGDYDREMFLKVLDLTGQDPYLRPMAVFYNKTDRDADGEAIKTVLVELRTLFPDRNYQCDTNHVY